MKVAPIRSIKTKGQKSAPIRLLNIKKLSVFWVTYG